MSADPLAWLVSLEGVPSAYAAARDGIDVVLRDRGLRRTSPETTAESLLRGAHASAVLEGSASSLTDMREGRGDEIAQAALRVSTELLSLAPALGRSPMQALARIHAVAASGSLPAERLGRPRDESSAQRLKIVADVLVGSKDVPALLVAGIVHADVVAAAPFASHNGIVARGVDEKSLIVPEAGHLALRPAYESNLRGYADGGDAGVHAWCLYSAEAFAAGAEASPLRRPAE